RDLVRVGDVQRTRLAMLAAAEPVAVAREPAVQLVRDSAYIRNLKHPRDPFAARKNAEQLLDGGRALPRLAVGTDELNRPGECVRRNPGEARHDAGHLRRHDLDLAAAIPFSQDVR